MKRSELMKRLQDLFGDDDVDIYLDFNENSKPYTDDIQVFIDGDGDAVLQPYDMEWK